MKHLKKHKFPLLTVLIIGVALVLVVSTVTYYKYYRDAKNGDGNVDEDNPCLAGYILGEDDLCHPECGNSGTYCVGDSECFDGQCLTCDKEGYSLGDDGLCYLEDNLNSSLDIECDPDYHLENDGFCYPDNWGNKTVDRTLNTKNACGIGNCISNGQCCPSDMRYFCEGNCYASREEAMSAGNGNCVDFSISC